MAAAFQRNLVDGLMGVIWSSYDALCESEYRHVDWSQDLRNLERSLSGSLERAVQLGLRKLFDGYHTVTVQHESQELETQRSDRGQAPTYDLAFLWPGDPRIKWGVEAKALRTDGDTEDGPGEYVGSGVQRFLDRRYAPYTTSGAMVAFLRSGSPGVLAEHIAGRLGVELKRYEPFREREHRVSAHERTRADGRGVEPFECHHLVFALSTS